MIKSHKLIIVKLAIATLTIISFFSAMCSSNNYGKNNEIISVIFKYNIPVVKLNEELQNITDSLYIFYNGEDILYMLPYIFTVENDTAITKQETRYSYFIYRKGENTGYYYSSLNADNNKLSVDSFLMNKAFTGNTFYDNVNDSLVETIRDYKNYSLLEKYISKIKSDQSYPDSLLIYYTNQLKGVDFTFSKELEGLKKLKISKIRMLYNSQFYKDYSFKFPKREFSFELKENDIADTKNVFSLFNRFRKDRLDKKYE